MFLILFIKRLFFQILPGFRNCYRTIGKRMKALMRTKIYQSKKPNGELRKSLTNVFKCVLGKPQKQFNGEHVISIFFSFAR